MSGHTPTPWFAVKGRYNVNIVTNPKGVYEHRVAECMWWTAPSPGQPDEATCSANASFIVLACNSHGELVAALEGVIDALVTLHAYHDVPGDKDPVLEGYFEDAARALRIAGPALAKAKGEAL